MISDELTTILRHSGAINGPIISELLDDLDFKCINLDIEDAKRKKIFNIAVEMFQNLYHYTRDLAVEGYQEDDIRKIYLALDMNDDHYKLITSNKIKNGDIESLRNKIDPINDMDSKELRAHYKSILNNDEFSDKGGAGLGFIDMKKRSGLPLEYSIEEIDEEISQYTLIVKV